MSPHSKRVLEPMDRISEVLFGLIMALTFTGTLSVAESGHAEVREMLVGAFGCNVAWGLVDGIMYLMACLGERGGTLRTVLAVRGAARAEDAHRAIADFLPPVVARALGPSDLERVRLEMLRLPDPGRRPQLRGSDWKGALGVFLLVLGSTLPVALPFVFVSDAMLAMRLSNLVAVAMMFLAGLAYGRVAGYRPWITGLSMVALGSALVVATILLGG